MKQNEKVLHIASLNNGYVTNKMVKENNIDTISLTRLVKEKRLVKIARGTYILPEVIEDEFYINFLKYSIIAYSRKTALYLNNLSNKALDILEVNVPINYNNKDIESIVVYRVNNLNYTLGLIDIKTPFGNGVKSYNKERCICDIFIFDYIDQEGKKYAIKEYLKNKVNYDKLYDYAEQLNVLDKVKNVFEVI